MNREEIENYEPSYTGHNVTLKSCFKRARWLSDKGQFSGIICNNQDPAKVVFLCKQLSDLNKENTKLKQQIEDLKCCGNCGYDNRNTKNNGGCFGCKDSRSGKKVYHGWKPKENK